jgi:hypothetical protein
MVNYALKLLGVLRHNMEVLATYYIGLLKYMMAVTETIYLFGF